MTIDFNTIEAKMNKAIDALKRDFSAIRTGRASPNMLDTVVVDAYGSKTPLPQTGTVNVPEPRLVTVQVWDASLVKAVEKAIRESGLGLNPQPDGQLIRVPIPDLNEERRIALTRIIAKEAEGARVSVRNVRRDGMDEVKLYEKEGELSKDAAKDAADEVQALTDKYIKIIDDLLSEKDKEVKTV